MYVCLALAWDSVKHTRKVSSIYPFVVMDPIDLGMTIMVIHYLCLTNFNLVCVQRGASMLKPW